MPKPAATDYYALLDLTPAASAEQIRTAYRQRIRLYHPDVHSAQLRQLERENASSEELRLVEKKLSHAQQRTQQLNRAYTVLSDPSQRAAYDRERRAQAGWTSRDPYNPDLVYDDEPRVPVRRTPHPSSAARSKKRVRHPRRRNNPTAQMHRKANQDVHHARTPHSQNMRQEYVMPYALMAVLLGVVFISFAGISNFLSPTLYPATRIPGTGDAVLQSMQQQTNHTQQTAVARTATAGAPTREPIAVADIVIRAQVLIDSEIYNEAIRELNQGIIRQPERADLYRLRGLAYSLRSQQTDDLDAQAALYDFNEAIGYDSRDALAYGYRGILKYDEWVVDSTAEQGRAAYYDLSRYRDLLIEQGDTAPIDPNLAAEADIALRILDAQFAATATPAP